MNKAERDLLLAIGQAIHYIILAFIELAPEKKPLFLEERVLLEDLETAMFAVKEGTDHEDD